MTVVKMRKKKVWKILMACMLTGALLAGCGSDQSEKQSAGTTQKEESEKTDSTKTDSSEETEESVQENTEESGAGKVLVVYYSATGSTKAVAEKIAEQVDGELFELQPVEEYTTEDLDYNNTESRVCKEHDDEDLRDVKLTETTVDNWDEVDTVFLGYPIWWGIAAWPVNDFVKSNDFTGKTVIPFCTSASSGLGDSGNLLEEMAGTGDWQEGMRFRSGASDSDVTEWVGSLNLVEK